MQAIRGNLVDLFKEEIYPAEVRFQDGLISEVIRLRTPVKNYLLPGLVDAHIHIESSLLVPSRFAEAVVPHGTIGTVSDPHEIANVLGLKGISYMEQDAKGVPLKIFFTAPSCVPATSFETSGANLDAENIRDVGRLYWKS